MIFYCIEANLGLKKRNDETVGDTLKKNIVELGNRRTNSNEK